ncbi:unnamed protein product [Cylicocyclus nassatus]|uniref:Peptidase C1A papain C-terminal domain-containing protein n=1 Tax=Cylicocyclus nassatus TaxID=53992 RepID=A0AA36GMC8_CYLNA|nr:unnamed protein product [Cylicocyclus nassatus]
MLLLFLLLTSIPAGKPFIGEELKKIAKNDEVEHLTGQALVDGESLTYATHMAGTIYRSCWLPPLVDYINSHQNLYKAKYKPGIEKFVRSRIMRSKYLEDPLAAELMERREIVGEDPLPESFDSREHWPKCAEVIGHIRDQSNCASCWAVANVEVMSDRLCIQSDAKYKVSTPSDTDLLACCGSFCGFGCEGGYTNRGWPYFKASGICTGGPYGDKKSCKPYAFYPCGKHENQTYYGPCPYYNWVTPTCRNMCQLKSRKNYESDKFWGGEAYVVSGNETAIRREIMTKGPVLVTFYVFEDFMYYSGGIYEHYYGYDDQGAHAVKIIGWGVEKGTKYWLVANSWNVDWGEKGFFRIIRGQNECGIEAGVIGGSVDLSKIH